MFLVEFLSRKVDTLHKQIEILISFSQKKKVTLVSAFATMAPKSTK